MFTNKHSIHIRQYPHTQTYSDVFGFIRTSLGMDRSTKTHPEVMPSRICVDFATDLLGSDRKTRKWFDVATAEKIRFGMERLIAQWIRAVDADPQNASLYSKDPAGRSTYWAPISAWRKAAAPHGRRTALLKPHGRPTALLSNLMAAQPLSSNLIAAQPLSSATSSPADSSP